MRTIFQREYRDNKKVTKHLKVNPICTFRKCCTYAFLKCFYRAVTFYTSMKKTNNGQYLTLTFLYEIYNVQSVKIIFFLNNCISNKCSVPHNYFMFFFLHWVELNLDQWYFLVL